MADRGRGERRRAPGDEFRQPESAVDERGTRILAAQDPPRIRASTDLANVPMAEAFTRAGYVNFERAINMTWK